MSQNALIEKIKNDADHTVSEIKVAGSQEVKAIESEIEAEVSELVKSHEVNLEKTKQQLELVAVSKAKQSGKIAVQNAKRKQIDSIFNAVEQELTSQDSSDYVSFFAKYVKEVVPSGVAITSVQAPGNRSDETKDIMKEAGLSGDVETDATVKAGLIVRAEDGVYDITLGRLMNEKRAELEMVVVNQVMS